MKKIRVLIVEDSSVMRSMLSRLLSTDADIEVVGVAPDPYIARDLLVTLAPDVMTLDINMPKMDGITFLAKAMTYWPIRTLIVSSLTEKNTDITLKALEVGAIDVIPKPVLSSNLDLKELARTLVEKIKVAANAQLLSLPPKREPSIELPKNSKMMIAIASSTGGTSALKTFLPMLPSNVPGIVIVQHMPAGFTKAFAQSLKTLCSFDVKEAQEGDQIIPNQVLIAPGNYHMEVIKKGANYYCKLHQEPLLHGVRPAADYLFHSVAKNVGKNALGIILTGMGKDGAEGLLAMKAAGAYTMTQNEKSCVVFGMPKEAIKLNAVHYVGPLDGIASELISTLKEKSKL